MAGKKAEPLQVVHPDSAGIDVGKRKHYVAVDPSRLVSAADVWGEVCGGFRACGAVSRARGIELDPGGWTGIVTC